MNRQSSIYNLQYTIYNFAVVCLLPSVFCLFSGCTQVASPTKETGIKNFPPSMVGTWLYQFGLDETQKWKITFNPDGTITDIYHYVFGPMSVEEGGIYKDGPDEGTYMVATLGPLESSYDPVADAVRAEIVIDGYEMKFVEGSLKGRIIDNLIGTVTKDGTIWEVEWRSISWLEGAAEPPIDEINAHPQMITFYKVQPNELQ